MTLLDQVLANLDTYVKIIKSHEYPGLVQTELNNIAALALSTYTEVFGGLCRGDLGPHNSSANYNIFINTFFPKEYSELDYLLKSSEVNKSLKGLYKAVRCGLVHEYFIRDTLIAVMKDAPGNLTIGIGILYYPNDDIKIKFVVSEYFNDFMNAIDRYRNEMKERPGLVCNYIRALQTIGAELPKNESFEFEFDPKS
jgi:hypothetical protein